MDSNAAARWAEIDTLFEAALDRPPDERTAWLRSVCGADPDLYRSVIELLESDAAAERILGESATVFAARLLDAVAADEEAGREDEDLADGDLLGAYRIVSELGRGGMGVVYRATRADGAFDREVALKLVRRGLDTDDVLVRFSAERRILAGLDHPGIARLLDAGAAPDGRPFLVMELVEGAPVTAHADARGLVVDARLDLVERIADAVTYAHRRLVVHRDLKPGNVLVTEGGEIKLLDFGIARLLDPSNEDGAPTTRPEWRVMTPEYAAPEQRRGEPPTTATDVYSLGVILYELLTGRRPGSPAAPPSSVISEDVASGRGTTAPQLRRRLRGDLDTLVVTALHEDPARRYASAEAFLEDLRRLRAGLPLRARPDTRRYRTARFVRRHRAGVAAGTTLAMLLVAFSVVVALQQRATARERDGARDARAEAEETTAFLEGLLGAADPYSAERADTLGIGDVIDRGVAAAERDLAGRPLVHARVLGVAGRVYHRLGRYDEATRVLRRAIRRHDDGGGDAAGRAALLIALGDALFDSREPDLLPEAERLFREALDTRRSQLGPNHPQVAAALNHLALVLGRRGDEAGAERLFRESLALHARAAPPDSAGWAAAMKNLADLLVGAARYQEADALLGRTVEMRRAHFGRGHPGVAVGLQSRATLLRDMERHADAEPLVREALSINRTALGNEHPFVADNLTLLGSVLRGMGRLDEARAALSEALARTRAFRGDRHPDVALALNSYAGLLLAREDYAAAREVLEEAVSIATEALGADHPAVGFNLSRLARADHGLGDHAAEAAGTLRAVRLFDGAMGDGNLHAALARGALGECLLERGRPAAAEPLLVASEAALARLHEADHPRVVEARARLDRLRSGAGP